MYRRLIMALTLTMSLVIGNYQASYAHSVQITSANQETGAKATLKLPNLEGRLEQAFTVGDPVEIYLGYDGNNTLEFEGYISEIRPSIPFEIRCEDGYWLAKRTAVNNGEGLSYPSVTLEELLNDITQGLETQISDNIPAVTLKPFRLEAGTTIAQALLELKKDYLLHAYFRGNTLYVGLPYTEFSASDTEADIEAGRYADYTLTSDAGNVVKDNLVFRRAEDIRLQAKAISVLPDNSRLEVSVGDPNGETRTLFFRNIETESELRTLAEAELSRLKYDGYIGTLTGFGVPRVIHGATVSLSDPAYPLREGQYLVDKVVTMWGRSGYRRTITLGPQV